MYIVCSIDRVFSIDPAAALVRHGSSFHLSGMASHRLKNEDAVYDRTKDKRLKGLEAFQFTLGEL